MQVKKKKNIKKKKNFLSKKKKRKKENKASKLIIKGFRFENNKETKSAIKAYAKALKIMDKINRS